jgi:hypothetical protein
MVEGLRVLAGAVHRQIPKYMVRVPKIGKAAHVVLAPAFIGDKTTLFTLTLDVDVKEGHRISVIHEKLDRRSRHANIATAGSGASLVTDIHARHLGRVVRKFEEMKGELSTFHVAREFAKVIVEISRKEPTVGPNSIVSSQCRGDGLRGAFLAFDGLDKAKGTLEVPWNANGMNINAIAKAVHSLRGPYMSKLHASLSGGPVPSKDEKPTREELNDALAKLPKGPDVKTIRRRLRAKAWAVSLG